MPLTDGDGGGLEEPGHLDAELLDQVAARIDEWAAQAQAVDPIVLGLDRDHSDSSARRWFVRLAGEDKAVTTVWLTLRERTLHVETQFMPAPEENIEACFEYLLRSNAGLYGLGFCIGFEDAVYLSGRVPAATVDPATLDRLVGGAWAWTEEHFRNAMTIGFASRYRHRPRARSRNPL